MARAEKRTSGITRTHSWDRQRVVTLAKRPSSAPVDPSPYGDDEPLQLAFLQLQEEVQLMFRIEELLDDAKEISLILRGCSC